MCLTMHMLTIEKKEKRNLFLGTRIQRVFNHFVVFVVWGYFSHWFLFPSKVQYKHNQKISLH